MSTKKFKKNDLVRVTSGRDKGKTGKIIRLDQTKLVATVEGVGLYKRHVKPTQNSAGGIKSIERPLPLAKLSLLIEGQGVKVGLKRTKGKTVRINKKTGKAI